MDPATVALVLGLPTLTLTAVGLGWGARAFMAGETDRADEAERQLLQRELAQAIDQLQRAQQDLAGGHDATELVVAAQRGLAAAARLAAPRQRDLGLLRAGALPPAPGAGPAPAPAGPPAGPDGGAGAPG